MLTYTYELKSPVDILPKQRAMIAVTTQPEDYTNKICDKIKIDYGYNVPRSGTKPFSLLLTQVLATCCSSFLGLGWLSVSRDFAEPARINVVFRHLSSL